MSIQILANVFDLPLKGPRKWVLVALANYADEGGLAWPCQETLARVAGISERCLREHLGALEAAGFVFIGAPPSGTQSTRYYLDCERIASDARAAREAVEAERAARKAAREADQRSEWAAAQRHFAELRAEPRAADPSVDPSGDPSDDPTHPSRASAREDAPTLPFVVPTDPPRPAEVDPKLAAAAGALRRFGIAPRGPQVEAMIEFVDDGVPTAWFAAAALACANKGTTDWAYCAAILRRYQFEGGPRTPNGHRDAPPVPPRPALSPAKAEWDRRIRAGESPEDITRDFEEREAKGEKL